MKLWQFAFLSIILIIILWFFSCGIIKKEDRSQQTAIEVNIVQRDHEEEFMVVRNISKGKIKHHVPKFMLELYEKSKMVKKDERIPDVVKSVIPAYGGTHYSNLLETDLSDNHHILVFNVPNSDKDEVFLKAELQVLTLIEIKSKLALGLERQIRISLYNETTNELKLLEEKHIYHSNNTWLSFNVSHAVKTVLQNPKTKILKFIIAVKLYQPFINNKKGVLKLSLMPVADNFEHNYPILLLFYTNVKIQTNQSLKETPKQENIKKKESFRVRRYIEEDYEEESNKIWDDDNNNKVVNRKLRRMRNNCRKRPLYVDFAEIQYDSWIVQPSGYEAYQCWGKCFYPVAEHLSPTKHAIVQALLHSVSPSRAPRSCCVPTKLDSISVLYVDAQGILTYRYAYKDMVVIDCGCR